MAGGLAALLDDISVLARASAAQIDDIAAAASRTSAKAVGVVVDDTAVTPKFIAGVSPSRELPMIWRIAKGSLFNKLVIVLPLALLLSWIAPWALSPLLMLGGAFLCFEGMEKVIEKVTGHEEAQPDKPADEKTLVRSAIATDLILSAEIMVISLNEVADMAFWPRTAVLVFVGFLLTALVYGVVTLLVKMDDIGMRLAKSDSDGVVKFGRFLVAAMPVVLTIIAVIGTFAMLWVGGHILVTGFHELGWDMPHDVIHHLVGPHTGALAWIIETGCSMVVGAVIGTILAGIIHVTPLKRAFDRENK